MSVVSYLALVSCLQLGWRAGTPEPVLDGDPSFVRLYWKAWENYQAGVVEDVRAAHFPPRYLAPSGRVSFDEACLHALYAKWGWRAAPVEETMRFMLSGVTPSAFVLTRDGTRVGEPMRPMGVCMSVFGLYEITGDRKLIEATLPSLMRSYSRLFLAATESGVRALPPELSLLTDVESDVCSGDRAEATAVLLLEASFLQKCAAVVGAKQSEGVYSRAAKEEYKRLAGLWSDTDKAFRGNDSDGNPAERVTIVPVLSVLTERFDGTFSRDITACLSDTKMFRTPMPFPLVPRFSDAYRKDAGVFPLVQYLALRALLASGRREEAGYAAQAMLRGYLRAGGENITLFSEYGAETMGPAPGAARDSLEAGFVAIGGLIEAVIGLSASAPTNTVEWNIWRADRHGLRKLRFGDNVLSLICEARESRSSSPTIVVECEKPFTLKVTFGSSHVERRFGAGVHKWRIR